MNFPDHDAVNAYTGFLLRKVSNASFKAFAEVVHAHGLHPMHFGMLTIIDAEEPISQRELSRSTGIDPSTMVTRMDVLDEHGLVERARGAGDRRSYEIRLSAAGRRLLGELREQATEHGGRFFSPLTPSERRRLHELLAKLAAGLDESGGACGTGVGPVATSGTGRTVSGAPRQLGRAQPGSQIARNIEAPQVPHWRSAVSDIRAIVEWAPQSGHSDLSS